MFRTGTMVLTPRSPKLEQKFLGRCMCFLFQIQGAKRASDSYVRRRLEISLKTQQTPFRLYTNDGCVKCPSKHRDDLFQFLGSKVIVETEGTYCTYLVLSSEAALGDHGSKRNRQILPRARASAPATAALILPLRTALPSPASRWSALVRGNNTPVVPR
ncbi:hypothetical protein BRADI_2g02526v3 [Brachypodium distachyon]|uniref:Uncharacterized protein n=1 Tax=Brachypodium distachyon TaxID=15368 RepID=A0A0Q3FTN9_BRADI|nr:hypothetical protein BRADI_2g02526v3 [Brachypodium distachyon]